VHLGALADALLQLEVVMAVPRMVTARLGGCEGGDHRKRDGERDGAEAMRRGVGEDRLHESTIPARPSLCSREMAARRSKHKPKRAAGATPTSSSPAQRTAGFHRDPRRWIYGGLDVAFAAVYAFALWKIIPNRLPSASLHLWTFPLATLVMGAGTLLGGRRGWWIAVVAGSAVLLSTVVLIIRIVVSAAFLAGVYGAFGKAAATFALVMIALVVELVALLPIVQVKYLMTRAGRRTYGVQ
jgi:hypothetical protein